MQVQDDMGGRELIETSTEEDTVVMEEGEKESSLNECICDFALYLFCLVLKKTKKIYEINSKFN